MGQRFFRIVGTSSYLVAALALVVTVFSLLGFAHAWIQGVDERIAYPTPTLQDFIEHARPPAIQHERKPSETASTSANNVEASDKYVEKSIIELATAINEYAALSRQNGVNLDALRSWIEGISQSLDEDDQGRLVQGMNSAFRLQLLEPANKASPDILANNIPGLKTGLSEYIAWNEWIGWYAMSWLEGYQEELMRIAQDRQDQASSRTESLSLIMIAASAFGVFFLATLVLLLVRIEANTRLGTRSPI